MALTWSAASTQSQRDDYFSSIPFSSFPKLPPNKWSFQVLCIKFEHKRVAGWRFWMIRRPASQAWCSKPAMIHLFWWPSFLHRSVCKLCMIAHVQVLLRERVPRKSRRGRSPLNSGVWKAARGEDRRSCKRGSKKVVMPLFHEFNTLLGSCEI
jgi:hypothetical protein